MATFGIVPHHPQPSIPDVYRDVNHLLSTMYFTKISDLNTRKTMSSTIPNNHPCEWGKDFEEDEDTYFLYSNNTVYGAVQMNIKPEFIYNNTIPFFYIAIRCSWGKINNIVIPQGNVTSGRLLWAFILRELNHIVGNNTFVVFNDSTEDAAGYHYKMGMRNIKQTGLDQINIANIVGEFVKKATKLQEDTTVVIEKLKYGGIENPIGSKKYMGGKMFYIKRNNINYQDILSILQSLYVTTRGGKKKRNKKNTIRKKIQNKRYKKTNRRRRIRKNKTIKHSHSKKQIYSR
jgi:hypothetical protein